MSKLLINQNGVDINVDVIKYFKFDDDNKEYLIYKIYDSNNNRYIVQAGEVIQKDNYIELNDIEDKEILKTLNSIVGGIYEKN